ncbi:MAG TPA: mobilization protein [Fibrobacteraceae bacterium]|nr:mobilization protein [Fibrobacteraceae bacterium]
MVFYIPKLDVMTKSAENIEKKIEAQLEKLKQLKAQKQAIEAREKTKQKEQERKDDTRRKILLGSYLIKKMQNEANKEKILAELNEYLTEDRDRQLFGLPDIRS